MNRLTRPIRRISSQLSKLNSGIQIRCSHSQPLSVPTINFNTRSAYLNLQNAHTSTNRILINRSFSSTPVTSNESNQEGSIKDRIDGLVKKNKIVVFMKGVPEEPKCGFSNAVVQVFRMHGVQNYEAHNVLADEALRQGVKDYSNWPTIPQIYMNGEFVGGCDILLEMHKNGELIEQLKKIGIKSALLEETEKSE